MTQIEALRLALEALGSNRRTHYYCEDTWYSCPKHEDGCANEYMEDECNCGADEANAGIDQAITAIKAALEAKDEPVGLIESLKDAKPCCGQYETCWRACTPRGKFIGQRDAQRKPLTDEEIKSQWSVFWEADCHPWAIDFARAIEAAHGIKE